MHSLSSNIIRWLLSPAVIQRLSVFQNMSLNSARDEALSQSSEVGRKLPSYPATEIRPLHPATEIRPLHWEVTRYESCWMMKHKILSHLAQGGRQQTGSCSLPKAWALALLCWGWWRCIFQKRHWQWLTQIDFVNVNISSSAAFIVSHQLCSPSGIY